MNASTRIRASDQHAQEAALLQPRGLMADDGAAHAVQDVRLSVDIGGTFTDVVLQARSQRYSKKVLTTTGRPESGVIEGAAALLADAGLSFQDVHVFVHGTTIPTNAVLERTGAKTALIGTEGFRDVLEIGTEGRFDQYDLQIEKRLPLVPRALRLTVPERVDVQGRVRLKLDREAVRRHVQELRDAEVESVAICFIHAYVNGNHERVARDILKRELPHLFVSISSEVCPEIREYERSSTTVTNAYVQPLIAGYLARMSAELERRSFSGSFYLVTSNGGLTNLETARRFPVRLIESGPAGGAIFAAHLAASAKEPRVMSFDMGGTTAKVCLIKNGQPQRDRVYEVDRAARFLKGSGLPIRIPVIDLIEIGAGGGSIAGVNSLRNVTVGPKSAGSSPGPACYGLGGTAPTVTDADLVLGLLENPRFAAGSIRLNRDAAKSALSVHVGGPLELSAEIAAHAVHEMVCESMASAARMHAIEKGCSIADYTLVAFGGAAPLHAARVAEKTGIRKIIIPPSAGVGSALGFLHAPISYEVVRSHRALLNQLDTLEVRNLLTDMERQARDVVLVGAGTRPLHTRRAAYMRYVGQGQELAIELPDDPAEEITGDWLRTKYEEAYRVLFSRIVPGAALEVLSWSVLVATLEVRSKTQSKIEHERTIPEPLATSAYFNGRVQAKQELPIYARESLREGTPLSGPALIVEDQTTTFVSDSFSAELDGTGNIVMQRPDMERIPI